jgi:hypothetical protein
MTDNSWSLTELSSCTIHPTLQMVLLGYVMDLFTFGMQVIDYYSKKGMVANLHAEKPPNEVTTEVQKVLSS